MNPLFRTYQTGDLPALIPLMSQLGYTHTEQSLSENITAVRNAGGKILVAEYNGEIVGCVSAILDVRLAEGIQGEIVSLVVNNNNRGLGLGKGLVNTAENWLGQHSSTIRVRANSIRDNAHRFYESIGYSKSKQQEVLVKRI